MAAEAVPPQSSRKCELTNLTKSCILHPLNIMLKRDKPHWEQLQKFCSELYSKVSQVKTDKRSQQMPAAGDSLKDSLQISVDEFEKGSLTTMDISLEIERKLVESLSIKEGHNDFDYDSLFRVCWKAYRVEKRPDTIVTEFSSQHPDRDDDCMYHLWLVFNAILSSSESDEIRIPVKCVDKVMRRVFDLCGHECSRGELVYNTKSKMLEYPEYLKAIANYNEKFDLKKTLTCEVIQDLKDEIVDAALKKSYITKRGHKLRTWKRRWFVLKKTILRYYESKEKPVLKGQMVINANTKVKERDNIGKRTHCFEVICGLTNKQFEMSADDEKSRHEWILAIKKAICLAEILSGSEDHEEMMEYSSNPHLSNFYLIKFGASSQSIIPKWEGGIKQVFNCSQSEDFSEEEDEVPTSSTQDPTLESDSVSSNSIHANESKPKEDPSISTDVSNKPLSRAHKVYRKRRQKFRSNPSGAGEMSLMSTCDQAPSTDSTRVTESTAINGVKEVNADLVVSDSTSGPVESCISAESTKASVSQYKPVADNGDSGPYYGSEDAPSAAESAIRPRAPTFLDKMQNLAFDLGAVPDFEESYCDL